ncbi:class C sortase [Microbacterium croceum]|uniref:class C sortase n=1 Tax=Microbacterium croceum TaxID=2851645 RepID=UPI001FFCCCFE|nr:class C sortase [Microbacterium croceum]
MSARRRPDPLLMVIVVAAVVGATVLVYSPAATWLSDYNQSLIVDQYQDDVRDADPGAAEQLAQAHRYNAALSAGALVGAGENVPTSDAEAAAGFDYDQLLRTRTGVMSRIQIPSIAVDLPVYHGTDDVTLLRGAGHLEGTSLPVGGASTHAVITAHRGLADAVMFTDLDQLRDGDRFTVTTFGEVLTYEVVDIAVVAPSDTLSLRQEAGRDLVTLVTCTPLGINSHRILVTGERVTPTPPASTRAAEAGAEGAGFPWWLLAYAGALLLIGVYAWRSSASSARARGDRDQSGVDDT